MRKSPSRCTLLREPSGCSVRDLPELSCLLLEMWVADADPLMGSCEEDLRLSNSSVAQFLPHPANSQVRNNGKTMFGQDDSGWRARNAPFHQQKTRHTDSDFKH